jgi:hypothetical protein
MGRDAGMASYAKTWGIGSSAPSAVRAIEQPLERLVSGYIGQLPFLWVEVPGPSSPTNDRKRIEAGTIALLANQEARVLRPAPKDWLGHFAAHQAVRASGLWNVDHVSDTYDRSFLVLLARYVKKMSPRQP